jgi:hypothetical protein
VSAPKTGVVRGPAAAAQRGLVKPRIGHAPARVKQEREKKEKGAETAKALDGAAVAGVGGAVAVEVADEVHHEPLQEDEHDVQLPEETEDQPELEDHVESEAHGDDLHVQGPVADHDGDVINQLEPEDELPADEPIHEPESVDPASALHYAPDAEPATVPDPEEHVPAAEAETEPSQSEAEASSQNEYEEPPATKETGDDLEDMVNMLQSGIPKARPVSIWSIPDEVEGEIPDEE